MWLRPAAMLIAASLSPTFLSSAEAAEYPIGEPIRRDGMEIAAVYLQPIHMDPPGMMRAAADSDVHLEADIHAAANNGNGYAEGDWIPYLTVSYTLSTADGKPVAEGALMPMVADDGPHYGDNVKLAGPGKYRLVLTVRPPNASGASHFGRHVDKETGVADWFVGFTTNYEFVFAGTGKKGGY